MSEQKLGPWSMPISSNWCMSCIRRRQKKIGEFSFLFQFASNNYHSTLTVVFSHRWFQEVIQGGAPSTICFKISQTQNSQLSFKEGRWQRVYILWGIFFFLLNILLLLVKQKYIFGQFYHVKLRCIVINLCCFHSCPTSGHSQVLGIPSHCHHWTHARDQVWFL